MAKILIAEDNATLAAHMAEQLKKSGHKVEVADSSLNAWRAIKGVQYDALLINVAMPGIDGFVLAQRGLTENPAMQIVFITGFAAVAMDTYGTPSYAPAPFTTRPFHVSALPRRLNALLHGGFYEAASEQSTGTVIYADFASKKEA